MDIVYKIRSALTLFVPGILANDAQHALPPNNPAVAAKPLYGWSDFHGKKMRS
jgi:hypothetical protein